MILQCPGCHKRLSLDDKNDGKLVKCPACGQQFRAGAPATRIPQPTSAVKARPAPTPPPPEDAGFEVVDDDYEVVDETPAAEAPPPPKPKPAKRETAETLKNAMSPTRKLTIKEAAAEEEAEDEPPPEDEEEARPRKKKKKKKKREPERAGAWIPWAVGFGGLFLLVGGVALAAIMAGMGTFVLFAAVYLGIMIPISTVILVLSMILSSAIAGGIEFGEIQVVIPKAMALLLIVNLTELVPIPFVGWFITFPVWLFGLMFLFRLDIWEARFLIFINWFLNTVAGWFVFLVVVAIVAGMMGDGFDGSRPSRNKNMKGQDAEAAYYFGEHATELRAWLAKDEKRLIFTRSREQTMKIATDLYDWGGKKVWAADPVENTRSGIPFTKRVIVELPRDRSARKKIIDYHNEVANQMGGFDIEDEGQKYVVIEFELKE